MNKPYMITLGLLLGSLVMVVPSAMPLVNLNIFSNAMAQGYYQDDYNNYQSSYEDMKKYSTYPTKDKKYVCQTGQFKGFFVESVEFCDLKIAQGPQGIQGIQGPSGITELNASNVYRNSSSTITIPANTITISVDADCDTGDTAINGFYSYTGTISPTTLIFRAGAGPMLSGNVPTEWFATVAFPSEGARFSATVFCFDNPPLR